MMTKFLFSLLFFAMALSAPAAPVRDKHVEAELIAEPAAIKAGEPFWVGLRLAMDEHWHTYWKNAGDSGLETKLKWSLPEGFSAGPIVWPHPQAISTPPLMSYGYEGETLLLVEITPPPVLTQATVTLNARADWLMCKEVCIPGRAQLELILPVAEDTVLDSRHTALFAATRARLPAENAAWTVRAVRADGALELTFQGAAVVNTITFFPDANDLIDHAAPQVLTRSGDTWTLRMPRSATSGEWPERIRGVAVAAPGWQADGGQPALAVDAALESAAPPAAASGATSLTLPLALLLAFGGGLVLNLMPCVFPVISIKLLGFVEQAGESRGRLLAHGFVFAAGVLVCFWVLAGTLLALRAGGAEIGWGFQLQEPRIVMALAALFFALGLSLFGLFEIGLSLTGAGQGLQSKSGLSGSFFSGLLATIVATPCTAPMMGAALGYALALPTAGALAIFTALGMGMASPYVLLSAMPGLIRKVPRPGPWMESMKQFMGFLMMATVVWLLWVLSLQTSSGAIIQMAALFLALAVAAWIAGRWGALHRSFRTRLLARVLAAGIAVAALAATLAREPARAESGGAHVTASGVTWEPFSPERVAELRAAGTPVFIDFTAAWCITCQANKRVALYNPKVEEQFKALGVATLRADWTDHDEVITRALAEFGRSGVPLYVLYGRDAATPPHILPELLTPGIVLDALAGIR